MNYYDDAEGAVRDAAAVVSRFNAMFRSLTRDIAKENSNPTFVGFSRIRRLQEEARGEMWALVREFERITESYEYEETEEVRRLVLAARGIGDQLDATCKNFLCHPFSARGSFNICS